MQTPEPDSSEQPTPAATKSRRSAKPWIISGGALVAAAGLYFGGAAWISSQIPANTTVSGVQIGSMNQSEARATLDAELLPRAAEAIRLQVHGTGYELDPEKAGLHIDTAATVADLTRYEINPVSLYQRLTDSYDASPVVIADDQKLTAAVQSVAGEADTEVAEGGIDFADGKASLVEPLDGVTVRVEDAAEKIADSWRADGAVIELPAEVVAPQVSAADLQAFLDAEVTPLLASPVTLDSEGKSVELSAASIAAAASYSVSEDGHPRLSLDDQKLYDAATKNSELGSTAKDARIVLADGKPKIIESTTGVALETSGLGAKVLAAAKTENRTAEVVLETKEPDFSTEDATKLGVKEEIVHFSTPYPASDTVRTKNLKAGAAKLNGILVQPGETFSLLGVLAPITTANGYYSSGVVNSGFATEAVGGGLSQISTQMYNVGFLAGYDDIEHKPHSRWFERYPAGREATLWEGQVDMKWKNNTPYGVMIQAWVSSDAVHTRLWSTKYWKVSESSSGKHSYTNPQTVYNEAANCTPESGGRQGFTISITRNRTALDGSTTLPADTNTWTYSPWNKVVCGKKP
ncbi:VanW family protein [Glutamicibacter sp. MNS18]|uniref:VanW family protein n=1 Tax=Glutamicibacter sp. MNS18 TaxID=2989817 RepID=UPI00223640EE|nr:VanW family protein [Glutamicibacter sp. MNS18]MCW4464940.1 VanW family protein [Glutamicibacter sp. MNS18]